MLNNKVEFKTQFYNQKLVQFIASNRIIFDAKWILL